MIFDIDSNQTAAAPRTFTASNKQSLISRQTFIHPPPPPSPSLSSPSSSVSSNKRRPLLQRHSSSAASSSSSKSSCCSGRLGELAGGTAAECAAICCCCPCGLMNLLYVTIYKLPAGLCRRALRRSRRKKLIKKGLLQPRTKGCHCGFDSSELHIYPAISKEDFSAETKSDEEELSSDEYQEEEAMMKLEEEMWKTFYSTGFWRSPSQREQSPKKFL